MVKTESSKISRIVIHSEAMYNLWKMMRTCVCLICIVIHVNIFAEICVGFGISYVRCVFVCVFHIWNALIYHVIMAWCYVSLVVVWFE